MERSVSVDDFVAPLWGLGSSASVHDLLKKSFPSRGTLAGFPSNGDLGGMQAPQLFQPASERDGRRSEGAVSSAMPRVPSLDLFRLLVNQGSNQPPTPTSKDRRQAGPPNPSMTEAGVPMLANLFPPTPTGFGPGFAPSPGPKAESASLPSLPSLGTSAAQAVPLATRFSTGATPALSPAPHIRPPVRPARPPAYAPSAYTTSPDVESENDADAKKEARRARRMLSNRESARRSRRRKQEHLATLEATVKDLTSERDRLAKELDQARNRVRDFESEVRDLREEVASLKRMLQGDGGGERQGKRHRAEP